ncbi:PREDICTED: uncharacterized protein LOC101303711 [Fragaria vesca subsp. vesca]|uniref:uncharacterized protein LOC101303711 n=1 Tax=Fragaria vesca subsp. vesca TaxID=101020 RepID=UPI0002C36A34|nr:PREDICTED: uncharacterized protein LOC101303711 [Fragaria vesca subsp. vesca]
MAFPRLRLSQRLVVVVIVALFCALAIDYVEGKESTPKEKNSASPSPSSSPSPDKAPAPGPSSDGILIDQGIACVLMLLALVLTYLIHDSDLPKIEWMKE